MTRTAWVLDINSLGAFDKAEKLARKNFNVVFTGAICRTEAEEKVRTLLKLTDGEILFYQADVSDKNTFELIESYVINYFGNYRIY